MSIKIEEGDVFIIPLSEKAHAFGVAARLHRLKRGKAVGLFAYFFGPFGKRLHQEQIEELQAKNAALRLRCSALYMHDGRWKIVGKIRNWRRGEWPLPAFYRHDLLRGTVWVHYDDNLEEIDETPYTGGDIQLTDEQAVSGSKAVEIELRQLFGIGEDPQS